MPSSVNNHRLAVPHLGGTHTSGITCYQEPDPGARLAQAGTKVSNGIHRLISSPWGEGVDSGRASLE